MIRRLLLAAALLLWAGAAQAETRPFLPGSWQALVQSAAGRPLVVHFWSLTCAPCLAEMPRLAEMRAAHPEMRMVMVSTDPIDQAPRLQATLARFGLGEAESWAFADDFALRLRFEVDRRWRGELPLTRLVGANGQTEGLTGTLEPDVLAAWLARQGGAQ